MEGIRKVRERFAKASLSNESWVRPPHPPPYLKGYMILSSSAIRTIAQLVEEWKAYEVDITYTSKFGERKDRLYEVIVHVSHQLDGDFAKTYLVGNSIVNNRLMIE